MWSIAYSDRLLSWCSLRESVEEMPLDEALQQINDWWFEAPWHPYGLHWDDFDRWPTPWELLEDSALCPVARAIGIMYTISLLHRTDLSNALMAMTSSGETVVIADDKILNWDRSVTLNTNSEKIQRKITVQEVRSRYS